MTTQPTRLEVRANMKLTDEQIIVLAAQHAGSDGWMNGDQIMSFARALLSASKGATHEGWKLVPVEPTQPMRDAFFADGGIERVDWLTKGYAAMLAASPAAGSE